MSSLSSTSHSIVGVIDSLTPLKKRVFGVLRRPDFSTGQSRIQFVCPIEKWDAKICPETVVEIIGKEVPLPEGKTSKYSTHELQIEEIMISSPSDSSCVAICPAEASLQVQLDERHMWFRREEAAHIVKASAFLLSAIRETFEEMECTEIIPPLFSRMECEGGATLFKLDHPSTHTDRKMQVYLPQSSQFPLELLVPSVGDTYCIYPSGRAEHSQTRRHLTAFTHVEAEWAQVMSLEHHCEKLQTMLCGIFKKFAVKAAKLLEKMKLTEHVARLVAMCDDVMMLSHKDAIEMCKKFEIYKDEEKKEHFEERDDIPEMQERALIDRIGRVVFLHSFPKEFKSFYMGLCEGDDTRVDGVDVEFPGVGEIVGSGRRESDYERLLARIKEAGLDPAVYREYLDLRKYGHHRTSGMGLGFERLLCVILQEPHIRRVTTFPRYPGFTGCG